MKIILGILLCCCHLLCFSQNHLKIITLKENGKTVFYAQNDEFCTVSIQLTLELTNLTAVEFGDGIYIVPKNTKKFKLFELARIKRGRTTYSYTYKAVYGEVNLFAYNDGYLYDLPYRKGLRFTIEQGYNGRFTHQHENALDFNMPEGTPILAAREGIVASVVQNNNETCLREACKKLSNYILICHSDGSFAEYAHIQCNGASVAVGDTIVKGEVIGISGSTGYAKGPHLHFVCFLPDFERRRTVATKFRIGKGTTFAYLAEDKSYKKNY